MGVPTSDVGYTIATTRRETTKVHKNMWWHWPKKKNEVEVILNTKATPSTWLPTVTSNQKGNLRVTKTDEFMYMCASLRLLFQSGVKQRLQKYK